MVNGKLKYTMNLLFPLHICYSTVACACSKICASQGQFKLGKSGLGKRERSTLPSLIIRLVDFSQICTMGNFPIAFVQYLLQSLPQIDL